MSDPVQDLLVHLGVDLEPIEMEGFPEHWDAFNFKKSGEFPPVPVMLIKGGPKNIAEARSNLSKLSSCIAVFRVGRGGPYCLFLKGLGKSSLTKLENSETCKQMSSILKSCNFASASDKMAQTKSVTDAMDMIPTHETDFDNRGIFSTHYLKNRMIDGLGRSVDDLAEKISKDPTMSVEKMLKLLGWNLKGKGPVYRMNDLVSIVVASRDKELGVRTRADPAPSYAAVSELKDAPWVILTNGTHWRLYTCRVSASTTNYFELNLGLGRKSVFRYLASLFGGGSYSIRDKKADIDVIFEGGKTYARELEEDLSDKILQADGIFLDLVKGVLNHDMKTKFSEDDLRDAKETALKIMYRVWFLLYAESRDLLPISDLKYHAISLQNLRTKLDTMEKEPKGTDCWMALLRLFEGVRKGSVEHNLPEYNGVLFKINPSIDGQIITNRFIVPVMRGLFEKDGDAMDYASLGVRHLGNIYENLMEFSVRQTDKDIMLLEDAGGIREVASRQESTYSYKKNDLYLASKGGIASRKGSGSYYTPEEIVKFLVKRGLDPLLDEREKMMKKDMEAYRKNSNDSNRRICTDRLLDLQVLDPSMGSGHFLVEALNQITEWVTGMLIEYRDHPLAEEIEKDRKTVIRIQKKKGIVINEDMLKDDVLLKRKIMKRCIFGVDLNPLAVELARLSLWLDSFAIGVPLTYMNHHLKVGDSTMGMWRDDLEDENQTLDDWIGNTEKTGIHMNKVSCSSDITIEQALVSEDEHNEYESQMLPHKMMLDVLAASKIDSAIIPKKTKNVHGFVDRFGSASVGDVLLDIDMQKTRNKTQALSSKHRFFHWELEMMDAFTDSRRGFDLIVGNPPWDTVTPNIDEFFTPIYPPFKTLKPKTKKDKKIKELCKDPKIQNAYDEYKGKFKEKNSFYGMYQLQGVGDRDMWQLILERAMRLVSKNGIISMLFPSQLLSNTGGGAIRKEILKRDILSLYVFENKKKIFPIHSSYRFVLLTFGRDGKDSFPVAFYLHDLSSLKGDSEKEKFFITRKKDVEKLSPNDVVISEVGGEKLDLLVKLSDNHMIKDGLGRGWTAELSRGFDKWKDADLLKEDGNGWLVHEGKHIHQFLYNYTKPEYVTSVQDGLKRISKKRVFMRQHKEIHNSFRLVFRSIARSTDMRTIIASILPPHTFHTYSLMSVILKHNGKILLDDSYDDKITYLCGILNSMTFDFIARSSVQMNVSSIMTTFWIPQTIIFDNQISKFAAELSIGTKEFIGLAESMRIKNTSLIPSKRIEIFARLDAMVAHAYKLTKKEYQMVLDSFKFGEDPTLAEQDSMDWSDQKTLRNFYGEVRKLAPKFYDEYGGNTRAR